jgi:hypothetical protein
VSARSAEIKILMKKKNVKSKALGAVGSGVLFDNSDPAKASGVRHLAAKRAAQLQARADELSALSEWLPDSTPESICVLIYHALLAER